MLTNLAVSKGSQAEVKHEFFFHAQRKKNDLFSYYARENEELYCPTVCL